MIKRGGCLYGRLYFDICVFNIVLVFFVRLSPHSVINYFPLQTYLDVIIQSWVILAVVLVGVSIVSKMKYL